MTDDLKTVPPAPSFAPPRPPQAPPLKFAGVNAPKVAVSAVPNPTLPRPTIPTPGAGIAQGAGLADLNRASLGVAAPPASIPSPNQLPLGQKMGASQIPPAPKSPTFQPLSPMGMKQPAPPAAAKPAVVAQPTPAAPASPSSPPSTPTLKPAEMKKSPFRFLPFILGGLLILGIVGLLLSKLLGKSSPTSITTNSTGTTTTTGTPVTLTYWGLWEPNATLSQVIGDYQTTHPNIKINYVQQTYQDYNVRLQTAIAQNQGPDIFRYHASWAPMLRQYLSPMPSTVYSDAEYKSTFYPIAVKQLLINGNYVGVPLEYDGLALFYNTDILNTANVQPPATWADMKKIAVQLTIRDQTSKKIQRAGLAIGNATNVDHFSDILGLLLLQNGVDPSNVTSQAAQDAVAFYTSFITQDKDWDDTLPNSTTAFARGDVAMILAPSWRAHDIQAMNPNLKFAIAPVPQLTSNKITWASYWAEGVSAQSPNKAAAWDFIKYMSSPATEQKFYSEASKVRKFGEIYSRKDLAGSVATDPYVGAFVSDAPYAQNWYLNSSTFDNGINDNTIKYFEDAVNQSLSGTAGSLSTTMATVQQGQAQVLGQYGIRVGATPTTGTGATTTTGGR